VIAVLGTLWQETRRKSGGEERAETSEINGVKKEECWMRGNRGKTDTGAGKDEK